MTGHLTSKEFADHMAALGLKPEDGPFAVAVSGGPDSMALALLFKDWAKASYLTFDHGLRAESKTEARQVKDWLTKLDLQCEILTWEGEKPTSGIQAAARHARYQAMENWCGNHGVKYLAVAHTRDDQAETFLIRLFRGSGVDGLAAMAPISPPISHPGGPKLLRPLLDVSKARLIATLKAAGQDWIEDPSNENEDFLRVQVRKALGNSDIEGFDIQTLAKTATRMARAKGLLQGLTDEVLEDALVVSAYGFGALDVAKLLTVHEEIGLRALSRMLVYFGGGGYPPRLEAVERLYNTLGRKSFKGATLAGCQLDPKSGGKIIISREVAAIKHVLPLKPNETGLWDGRFEVHLNRGGSAGDIRALGQDGWLEILSVNPDLKALDIPLNVIFGLPAFFNKESLQEIPHLNIPQKGGHLSALTDPKRSVY